jgi:hypothetical protein
MALFPGSCKLLFGGSFDDIALGFIRGNVRIARLITCVLTRNSAPTLKGTELPSVFRTADDSKVILWGAR